MEKQSGKIRSCLYDIGYIRQKGEWFKQLKEFSGQSYIPMVEMDMLMRAQLKDGRAYLNENGAQVSEVSATQIRLSTGIRTTSEKGGGKIRDVVITYKKNDYGIWEGVEFEFGDEVACVDEAQGEAAHREIFSRDVYFKTELLLKDLADIAVQEAWQNEYGAYGMLLPYIKYTYTKLERDGKLKMDDDQEFMVFNTGLVSRKSLCPIVAVCRRNAPERGQKWCFDRYLVWQQSELPRDRHFMKSFKSCPPSADWFSDLNCTILRTDMIEVSDDVYSKLKKSMEGSVPIEILEAVAKSDGDNQVIDRVGQLRAMYRANKIAERDMRIGLYNSIISTLGGAKEVAGLVVEEFLKPSIDIAIKRLKWEIGTAVPMWDPSHDGYDFILPLSLGVDPMKADIALILEPFEVEGKYRPSKFLSLRNAYSNARLLRRPEAFWLREYIEG